MVIKQNVPMSELTTIKIGGAASVVVSATSPSEMLGAIEQVKSNGLPYRVLGWGSNVVGRDEGFAGVVIVNKIGGLDVLSESDGTVRIRAGAGESLDTVVAWSVELGLTGIEALSSIPGTVGAAPVQNAGAYGQEIGDHLESVDAIDTETLSTVTIAKADCGFKYRDSVFKHNGRRHVIIGVTLALTKADPQPPFYKVLQSYLDERGITDYTPHAIRDAVIQIRREKLPSPMLLPNSGSFFKNPHVDTTVADAIAKDYPELPRFKGEGSTVKLPAGWLIEHAGFKGYVRGPLQTYGNNALVLVNSGKATYAELDSFRSMIIDGVRDTFGVTLEQEPEEL